MVLFKYSGNQARKRWKPSPAKPGSISSVLHGGHREKHGETRVSRGPTSDYNPKLTALEGNTAPLTAADRDIIKERPY